MRVALPSLALLVSVLFNLTHTARTSAQPSASGARACGGSWETYTYPGEEFSAALPEMPALDHESRGVNNSDKIETAREYGAYGDGVVYVLWAYDNPRPDEDINYFASLFFFPSGDPGRRISMSDVRDIKLGGFAGRRFQPTADTSHGPSPQTPVYVYLTKKHAYAFTAVGADESHPCVQRFLNSFALSSHPNGQRIDDEKGGNGEQGSGGIAQSPAAPGKADAPAVGTGVVTGAPQSGGQIDYARTFNAKEVTRKAIVVTKPEPSYTESARRDQITGTVMLRMVLRSDGKVSNIAVLTKLPGGLTEKAVVAARHVKFIPAVKDGHNVSQYVAIVYNFNIY